jgi:hypothetical protein
MELKISIQVATFGRGLGLVDQWFLFRFNNDNNSRYLKIAMMDLPTPTGRGATRKNYEG